MKQSVLYERQRMADQERSLKEKNDFDAVRSYAIIIIIIIVVIVYLGR